MARLVPDKPTLCTVCGHALAKRPKRCVNPECALSSFVPDPTFGTEYAEDDAREDATS